MICPNCAIEMTHMSRHGVTIDRCDICGGTWLDHGELETIVEAVRGPVITGAPQPAPRPRPKPKAARKPSYDRPAAREWDDDRYWDKPKKTKKKKYKKSKSTSAKLKYILKEILD